MVITEWGEPDLPTKLSEAVTLRSTIFCLSRYKYVEILVDVGLHEITKTASTY
ncbi:hypothetical protein AZOA_39570 [Azoarcus sp. Aa7]|nr:hypothetical protein [Azoarcus sp. Aa7]